MTKRRRKRRQQNENDVKVEGGSNDDVEKLYEELEENTETEKI